MSATPFVSRSLMEHLLRGAAGITALVLAVHLGGTHPLPALGLIAGMVAAFRGCPICWTMGLVDTLRILRAARRNQPGV